ncbi:MAG: glycosyltransferase [Tepidisphaeraceae bacterium]|jgi:hypothetical protein
MRSIIGLRDTARGPFPPVHPAVANHFAANSAAPIQLYPVNLDMKQAECVRCLLCDQRRTCITADWNSDAIAVFLATDANVEDYFLAARPRVSIFLDPHDKGRKLDFLLLSDAMWETAARENLQIIYLKLQVHDASKYAELNRARENVHVLSWPLLLGGSRFHITVQEDFAGENLFSRTLLPNVPANYEFDFSCIGAITSPDRQAAFDLLAASSRENKFLTISKPGHADAAGATVPLEEYLRISRASRICVSLNGRGPWCLKDGELLANGCFILRQWHPSIDLNPLTPRDGVHWRIFRTENLLQTIEQCLAEPRECERIAAAGHAMFREAVRHSLWSKRYAEGLGEFLQSGKKSAWGELAFG